MLDQDPADSDNCQDSSSSSNRDRRDSQDSGSSSVSEPIDNKSEPPSVGEIS